MYRSYEEDREYAGMDPAKVKYRREQNEPRVTRSALVMAAVAAAMILGFCIYQIWHINALIEDGATETLTVNQISDAINETDAMSKVKGLTKEESKLAVDAVKAISTYDAQSIADGTWAASVLKLVDGDHLTREGGHTNLITSRVLNELWLAAMADISTASSTVESAAVEGVSVRSDVDGTAYKVVTVKAVTTRLPKDGADPVAVRKLSSYEETYKVYMISGSQLVRNIQRTEAKELRGSAAHE